MFLKSPGDAHSQFEQLSLKERELLDQILQYKTLKVIAHDLGITLSAVDQRLKSSRGKLGASDRNEAARIYSGLLEIRKETTCGFAELGTGCGLELIQPLKPPSESIFTFRDSATIEVVPPGLDQGQPGTVWDKLDERFGCSWRVAAIPLFAIIFAMLALALMAMAKALAELL